MASWHDISCEELCDHITSCLGTSMYRDSMLKDGVNGNFFFMMSSNDAKMYYDFLEMKFHHRLKLNKWLSACKDSDSIVEQSVFDSPSVALRPPHSDAGTATRTSGSAKSGSRGFSDSGSGFSDFETANDTGAQLLRSKGSSDSSATGPKVSAEPLYVSYATQHYYFLFFNLHNGQCITCHNSCICSRSMYINRCPSHAEILPRRVGDLWERRAKGAQAIH